MSLYRSAESKRALWKIGDVSDAAASGSLRAKFELTEGPSKPATLAVQFTSEGTTLSGLDIDLLNTSYRLSLVKKRFSSGEYLCMRSIWVGVTRSVLEIKLLNYIYR